MSESLTATTDIERQTESSPEDAVVRKQIVEYGIGSFYNIDGVARFVVDGLYKRVREQ